MDGAWLGYDHRSSEHLIALPKAVQVIRDRKIKSRLMAERWSADAVEDVRATLDQPKSQRSGTERATT